MIAPTVNALPSRYRGVLFRSRLEARWAIYFDLIGLDWNYEPEGYALPSGNYCPDFWCGRFFVEVKPHAEGRDKAAPAMRELARLTGKDVYCVVGLPSLAVQWCYGPNDGRYWADDDSSGEFQDTPARPGDEPYYHEGGAFCRYAIHKWGEPFYGGDGVEDWCDEMLWHQARNARFNNGVAL